MLWAAALVVRIAAIIAASAPLEVRAGPAATAAPTRVIGLVRLGDGTPVAGAVVVTSRGGRSVSRADGAFDLTVDVEPGAALHLIAVASVAGATFTATAITGVAGPGDARDAGAIVVRAVGAGGACAPAWIPTFDGQPGTNARIRCMTVLDDGRGPGLYAGGDFDSAGGVPASRIARWDGAAWSALDAGADGFVRALCAAGDGATGGPALLACGDFVVSPAGDTLVARWVGCANARCRRTSTAAATSAGPICSPCSRRGGRAGRARRTSMATAWRERAT
jgi:hypothetical protein